MQVNLSYLCQIGFHRALCTGTFLISRQLHADQICFRNLHFPLTPDGQIPMLIQSKNVLIYIQVKLMVNIRDEFELEFSGSSEPEL